MRIPQALLAAIRESPDDDLPRLAYADWCEEAGLEERAEFIRVCLEMERTPRGTPAYRRLWEREVELIRRNKDDWFGSFRLHWSHYEVWRGFLDDVSAMAPVIVPHLGWLMERHPVRRLVVGSPDLGALPEVLASPLVETLSRLRYVPSLGPAVYFAEWNIPDPPGARLPLAERPLDVTVSAAQGQDGASALRQLASSPRLSRLGRLELSLGEMGAPGAALLLEGMQRWPMLTTLVIRTGLGPEGLRALLGSPLTAQLCALDLSGEPLARSGPVLLESRHLFGLERLLLGPQAPANRDLLQRLQRRFGPRLDFYDGGSERRF
jgi:uncharacterized protein (TIGR02996 family)